MNHFYKNILKLALKFLSQSGAIDTGKYIVHANRYITPAAMFNPL